MTIQELKYRFTLDAFKNGMQRVLQGFQTGENVARSMEISLMSGTTPFEIPLDGITAVMYVTRPSDDTPSINACTISAENNKIIYRISSEDIAEAGVVKMQLKLIDIDDVVLISPMFGMEVWESTIEDSDAEQSPTYTALTQALADAIAMKNSAIADLYIDENNIFTVVFGDGTTYTSSVLADAIGRIDSVERNALKAEGYAVGTQDEIPVESSSPYYHNNAKYYSEQAGTSASNAATSATNASASESNAHTSEVNAGASALAAFASESNASNSESNALSYKNAAAQSESNAATSETNASNSATAAAQSEANALIYKGDAKDSKDAAAVSETNASTSANLAAGSATSAGNSATMAESYNHGNTGARQGEANDNAKYYMEQCQQIAAGMAGGLLPMGTVTFANLPTTGFAAGWMYNISDAFTSDSRFKDGGGKSYPAGTNAYVTADLMWDCFAGSLVTVNNKTGQSITLDGGDINVTGYSEPSTTSAIAATDTLNAALGKLERKIDNEVGSSRVTSFNSRTGAVSPADGDYTGSMIPLTGYSKASSRSAIATTDKVNAAFGKLEYKLDNIRGGDVKMTSYSKASSRNSISTTDTVNQAMGKLEYKIDNVRGSDVTMTGYTKASSSSAIATTDTANQAMGKLEYKIDQSNAVYTVGVQATDWEANSDSATNTRYPYVIDIDESHSSANSNPTWEVFGVAQSGIPTDAEHDCIVMIEYAIFNDGTITLYATDQVTEDLILKFTRA